MIIRGGGEIMRYYLEGFLIGVVFLIVVNLIEKFVL